MRTQRIGLLLIAVLFVAVCSNIPGSMPFAVAQDQNTIQGLIDFTRQKGHLQAIGIPACRVLGLKPVGDCEVLQVLQSDGKLRSLNTFDEPGTGQLWIIISKELEGGAAVMVLMDRNGASKRAARRTNNNGMDLWSPFSLEADPAVLTSLGEFSYWLKLVKDSAK